MIEVTPQTTLPFWPAYLDGNVIKYEPQQLEYLDGNLKIVSKTVENLEHVVVLDSPKNEESFNFIDNGEAILSTNVTDFNIFNNTISYHSTLIDLGKSVQEIDDLIVVKAKTPGFYVWTRPTDFGSFLVKQGTISQNADDKYIDTDFTFCLNYPKGRNYTLVSQFDSRFKVYGVDEPLGELTSADRPLAYHEIIIPQYTDDITQRFIDNYPWKTDNYSTVRIDATYERIKCFILIVDKFYWANLSFKEAVSDTRSSYEITNLSYTKVERVLSYGDKLIEVKKYNKLLSTMV